LQGTPAGAALALANFLLVLCSLAWIPSAYYHGLYRRLCARLSPSIFPEAVDARQSRLGFLTWLLIPLSSLFFAVVSGLWAQTQCV
jgi:hypothetical protein